MATPALAYPDSVFIKFKPLALQEKTSKYLDPAKTGILKPEVVPLITAPMPIIPVYGVNVTTAPGTAAKLLLPAAA